MLYVARLHSQDSFSHLLVAKVTNLTTMIMFTLPMKGYTVASTYTQSYRAVFSVFFLVQETLLIRVTKK